MNRHSSGLTLEQLHAAERRARERVQADRPGDRALALRTLRAMRTKLRNAKGRTHEATP